MHGYKKRHIMALPMCTAMNLIDLSSASSDRLAPNAASLILDEARSMIAIRGIGGIKGILCSMLREIVKQRAKV